MTISRLIRFVATDGKVYFGEALNAELKQAYEVVGDVFNRHQVDTTHVLEVLKLLAPLQREQIGTIRMIGMNYKKHAEEIQLGIPEWPCLFYKPSTALNGTLSPIKVPQQAQIEGAKIDYESELVVVIGKEGKNIPEDQALDFVLGYTVGNDVSQRTWQIERGGSQFNVGKMFDTWAPIGPCITTTKLIEDPNALRISSRVNGEVRQNSNTNDAIFSVKKLIAHLSMGTTLLPGDLIFTGTPQGVGSGFKPPRWLKDGDTVECSIENIGTLQNNVVFE